MDYILLNLEDSICNSILALILVMFFSMIGILLSLAIHSIKEDIKYLLDFIFEKAIDIIIYLIDKINGKGGEGNVA